MECSRIIAVDVFDVYEDEETSIPSLSILNDDNTELSNRLIDLTVACLHGSIKFPTSIKNGLREIERGVNSSYLTMRGTRGQLNSALEDLTYTPRKNYYGSDSISLYMRYHGALMLNSNNLIHWVNESFPIQVLSVDDVPTVINPHDYLEVLEDSVTVLTGISIESDDFIESFSGPYTNPFISNPLLEVPVISNSSGTKIGIAVDMPRFTSTMKEGRISAWHKEIGEKVWVGDLLYSVDIWPDNDHLAVKSTVDGYLAVIRTPTDHIALVGAAIAMLVQNHTEL